MVMPHRDSQRSSAATTSFLRRTCSILDKSFTVDELVVDSSGQPFKPGHRRPGNGASLGQNAGNTFDRVENPLKEKEGMPVSHSHDKIVSPPQKRVRQYIPQGKMAQSHPQTASHAVINPAPRNPGLRGFIVNH